MWDGQSPSPNYSPKKLEGAIILGTGGDGSNGVGTFFEGAMTAGNPSDAVDEQIQANIVAAGYGH
jgi:non-reducing end alpha-L-arabinofuranosidase